MIIFYTLIGVSPYFLLRDKDGIKYLEERFREVYYSRERTERWLFLDLPHFSPTFVELQ
jgi:hypothetical protein